MTDYPDSYERFNLKYDKVTVPVMYGNIWDHCMSQEFFVSVFFWLSNNDHSPDESIYVMFSIDNIMLIAPLSKVVLM